MDHTQRFWSKVDKSGGPDACWEWTACKNKAGYGLFGGGGKTVLAHRFAYELENGLIPDGLCACHRCDNPGCVNHDHIFLGTHLDNMADREAKGRQAAGDRSGRRLHPEAYVGKFRGERHGRAKLTLAQVVEIRALYTAGGVTYSELGSRFGVSKAAVGSVVRGEHWKEAARAVSRL